MKTCKKCLIPLELAEFNKSKLTKDGLVGKCKRCESEYGKEYRAKNAERLKKQSAEYRASHKIEAKRYADEYYINNRDSLKEYAAEYYIGNRDHVLSRVKEYSKLPRVKESERVRSRIKQSFRDWTNRSEGCSPPIRSAS